MSSRLIGIIIIIFMLPRCSWSQGQVDTTWFNADCPDHRLSTQLDSIAIQSAIDSITSLISGRWELIETHHDAYNPIRKPDYPTKMTLDKQGNGVIYQNNQVKATFQLTIVLFYGFFRFNISEEGRQFFYLPPYRRRNFTAYQGGITACGQRLLISGVRSSSIGFVFKRISP
jgi:hypothetical protein